jgi:hypothetical protein
MSGLPLSRGRFFALPDPAPHPTRTRAAVAMIAHRIE